MNARLSVRRGAGTCLLAVLAASLVAGCGATSSAAPAPSAGGTGVAAPAAAPAPSAPNPPSSTPPAAAEGSVRGLPGTLFYVGGEPERLYRLTPSGPVAQANIEEMYNLRVAPDGRRIAYVKPNHDLMVADSNGRNARRLRGGVATDGFEPSWSADGTRLLVALQNEAEPAKLGVVDVASGRFTRLPRFSGGLHHMWSGDGQTVIFADGECALLTAAADGGDVRKIPVIGDESRTRNPSRFFACNPLGVSRDGSRVAVDLLTGSEPFPDIVGSSVADTIVDTRTGEAVPVPVRGAVSGLYYQPDGTLLVRSRQQGRYILTLLSPTDQVIATVTEPTSVRKFELRAYTR